MGKVSFMDRRILVFTCINDPDRKPHAVIDGWNMMFPGATPMKAKANAEQWRREAIASDKLLSKARKAELLGESAA